MNKYVGESERAVREVRLMLRVGVYCVLAAISLILCLVKPKHLTENLTSVIDFHKKERGCFCLVLGFFALFI